MGGFREREREKKTLSAKASTLANGARRNCHGRFYGVLVLLFSRDSYCMTCRLACSLNKQRIPRHPFELGSEIRSKENFQTTVKFGRPKSPGADAYLGLLAPVTAKGDRLFVLRRTRGSCWDKESSANGVCLESITARILVEDIRQTSGEEKTTSSSA